MDMASFTINMISIIVAVIALIITWVDSRRNNRVTIKVVDLTSGPTYYPQDKSHLHVLKFRYRPDYFRGEKNE